MRDIEKSSNVWYTPTMLEALALPALPRTAKGIREKAKRDGWPHRRVPGRGGRDGQRDEFQPPADLQLQIDELAALRIPVDSRSDAALRHAVSEAPNPASAFEAMRKIRDASDLLQRFEAETGYALSKEWLAVLLELRAGDQLSETGARRIIEHLKWLESQ